VPNGFLSRIQRPNGNQQNPLSASTYKIYRGSQLSDGKKKFDIKTLKDFIVKCSLILCVTDFTRAAAKQTQNAFIQSTQVFRIFQALSCQIPHNVLAFSFITTATVSLKIHQTTQIEWKQSFFFFFISLNGKRLWKEIKILDLN